MIEIAIDNNLDDSFLGLERPSYIINSFSGYTFDSYRQEASLFIKQFANQKIVIVRINQDNFSLNKFALALFVESYFVNHTIDCVVFKLKNAAEAISHYKPFVALTIGLKYAFTISNDSPKRIYNGFTELGYLGLDITKDYFSGKINIKLHGSQAQKSIKSDTLADSIVAIAMLKALSLAKVGANIELDIIPEQNPPAIDKDYIINKLIQDISPWIS